MPAAISLHARKQQVVRDQIWDTAIKLFGDKGFDETTVDDIALEAGVSRRTFFRYFSSKNDLLAQGVQTYGIAVTEAIENCPRSFSLPEILRQTVHQVAKFAASNPRTPTLIEIASKYPAAREAQLSRMGEVQTQVALAFAARCKGGRKNGDLLPNVLARLTLLSVDTALQQWFGQGRGDISPIVDQVFITLSVLTVQG